MRAPPLARIPAVAAPRPDAEPVTITHKPSLDIGFLLLFEPSKSGCRSTIPPDETRNSIARNCGMPAAQSSPMSMLVRGVAFPHHALQRRRQMPIQTGERRVGE